MIPMKYGLARKNKCFIEYKTEVKILLLTCSAGIATTLIALSKVMQRPIILI